MATDYKDINYKELTAKEIQLLMLQELRQLNEKLSDVEMELDDSQKRLIKLESFRTQVITALIVVNVVWGVVVTLFQFLS